MHTTPVQTDPEIISSLKAGNFDAFEGIYKQYWLLMYAQAFRMLKDEDEAEDLVQEIFTNIWLKKDAIAQDTNLGAYLYTATKNRVLDLIAYKRVRFNYLESLTAFTEMQKNQIEEFITEKEMKEALETEIQKLPPKMKQIFEMRVKQHMSYAEISAALEISDKTVKKQIHNAIKIIRPKLQNLSGWAALLYFLNK